MKKRLTLYLLLFLLVAALQTNPLMAQYQIRHWSFNNGSATFSNNSHTIVNSVGEPATGMMSNNQLVIKSGFIYAYGLDSVATSIDRPDERVKNQPDQFALGPNYPNPFNPTTVIKYEVPVASAVKLEVFNPLGRKVSVLVNERKNAGRYSVKFDASNLAGGVYLYRFTADDYVQTRKMLLIK